MCMACVQHRLTCSQCDHQDCRWYPAEARASITCTYGHNEETAMAMTRRLLDDPKGIAQHLLIEVLSDGNDAAKQTCLEYLHKWDEHKFVLLRGGRVHAGPKVPGMGYQLWSRTKKKTNKIKEICLCRLRNSI